jgi:hypothetical protein
MYAICSMAKFKSRAYNTRFVRLIEREILTFAAQMDKTA